jgi:hypothetical protein
MRGIFSGVIGIIAFFETETETETETVELSSCSASSAERATMRDWNSIPIVELKLIGMSV